MTSHLYIGLMSGTSADSIDAALLDLSGTPKLLDKHSHPLPPDTKQEILALCQPGDNEIDRMGSLDRQLGHLFAQAVEQLLRQAQLPAQQITAIGSHGQTIRHRPPGTTPQPFSLQIGDPNIIAEETAITTVADLRRRDMAAGGQGAPLAPSFHRALFQPQQGHRCIVNIGGMANISWLAADGTNSGFDTGPGNALLDYWIHKQRQQAFDHNGDWAASGHCDPQLLDKLLQHPFFAQPAPKSTGREAFNAHWLEQQLTHEIDVCDIQATLTALSAHSIAEAIRQSDPRTSVEQPLEIFICGGGTHNRQMMKLLSHELTARQITSAPNSTEQLGIDPDWVEAAGFAWLAKQCIERQTTDTRATTGARQQTILGGIYYA